jgi:hypothetical protein
LNIDLVNEDVAAYSKKMTSVPRRRPIVAPLATPKPLPLVPPHSPINPSLMPFKSGYQMIKGFTRIPVASDGNCFYTATGFFYELNASAMRNLIVKYFIFKKAEYSIFFESEAAFIKAVKENSMARIWNNDLADILPYATAQLLQRDIIVHNYDNKYIKQIRIPVTTSSDPPIHLFRSNCHYEILLDNDISPNKNICALPDVSEILSYVSKEEKEEEEEEEEEEEDEEEEEEEVEEEGDVEDSGYESDDEKCMIRL